MDKVIEDYIKTLVQRGVRYVGTGNILFHLLWMQFVHGQMHHVSLIGIIKKIIVPIPMQYASVWRGLSHFF